MKSAPAFIVSAVALSSLAAPALGAIITPITQLNPGQTLPGSLEADAISPPVGGPIGAIDVGEWYTLDVAELTTFSIEVRRQTEALDPVIFVFQGNPTGLETFTEFASGTPTSPATLTFLGSADNELPADGPNGDPRFTFTTPIGGGGIYSVVVVASGDSVEGDRNYPYTIEVEGALPAPGTALLLLAPIATRRKH
ncbi:MAG: hypothetical protein AAGD00_02245 [Planctomycetota bacterium]